MDAIECIKGRRSIRKFKGNALEDGLLESIISLAAMSPSWGNSQCARYVAVSGDQKAEMAKLMPEGNNKTVVEQAPIIIALCAVHGKAGVLRGRGTYERAEGWTFFDCGGAAQTLCLAAYEKGVGSLQMGVFDFRAIGELLKLPEGVELVELIALGYPDIEPQAPVRLELSELLHYNEYYSQPI